jgi:hypothetical protein
MIPITPLIFAAAVFVALLPECELWLLDGDCRTAPREVQVDFAGCGGPGEGVSADACARLRGGGVTPEELDDFDLN